MFLSSPFLSCGMAARSDLEHDDLVRALSGLELEQRRFLAQEKEFRSGDYGWPRDALHWWSRVWEYPYVWHNLVEWGAARPDGAPRVVVDLGCGVTFFPYALARSGFHVVCSDVDPVVQREVERAIAAVPHPPGQVSYRHIEGERLPFEDAEVDGLYCVSVLEHIPNLQATIDELARVVRPDGLAVITLDLDLRGDLEIGPEPYYRLIEQLGRHFEPVYPLRVVHPADVLTSANSPHRTRAEEAPLRRVAWSRLKHTVRKAMHRGPQPYGPTIPFLLAVDGWTLRRRA